MNKKPVDVALLSKEELVKKCLNQKENINQLNNKIKNITKELYLKNIALSNMKVSHKIQIYMSETLSLINDVERLKKEIKEKKIE